MKKPPVKILDVRTAPAGARPTGDAVPTAHTVCYYITILRASQRGERSFGENLQFISKERGANMKKLRKPLDR
jgi:hypothetical protein